MEKYVQYIYAVWEPPVNSQAMQSVQELAMDPSSPWLLAPGNTGQLLVLSLSHSQMSFHLHPAHCGSPSTWSKILRLPQ